jgi:flagellar motor switch protein FliN/FliY
MSENSKNQDPPIPLRAFEETQHYQDVPMKVMARLGNCQMKIREILELKKDSIVELPKSAGENIDVVVNGSLIAFGEVLEMEGSAGIRLTDLYLPS